MKRPAPFLCVLLALLGTCNQERKEERPERAVAYRLHGICFSPYLDGQDPNRQTTLPESQIAARMALLEGKTEWIRTFGMTHGLEVCGRIARNLGLNAALGAWIGTSESANQAEIANLIAACVQGQAQIAIVGSEVLLRRDLPLSQLIAYIRQVKSEVPSNVLVTYADTYNVYLEHPKLVEELDILFVNYYPFWEGASVKKAISALNYWHGLMLELAQGKAVIVSETGWPSGGEQLGEALPSPENAAFYFKNFVTWARTKQIAYFYFSGFDEAWKTAHEGTLGAHWGIFDRKGNLKPGMRAVFDGKLTPIDWFEGLPGGPGEPTLEIVSMPPYGAKDGLLKGRALHVDPYSHALLVYIMVDQRWWIKPTAAAPKRRIWFDGSFECDIVTGGNDHLATSVALFLVAADYDPPIVLGGTLPATLYERSLAHLKLAR